MIAHGTLRIAAAVTMAALLAAALALAPGCGDMPAPATNAGTSIDPSSLDFPEEVSREGRPLLEAAEGFLSSLEAGSWPEAYGYLDTASRSTETEEEYAARWEGSTIRVRGYELVSALILPDSPNQGVARAEIQVRNQKSDEVWLEYLWLVREAGEWRIGSASWK